MLRPALVIDLLILVLYSHCGVEVGDYQAEVFVVDKKVVRLNISMGDTVLVKIREALDQAQAELGNLAFR